GTKAYEAYRTDVVEERHRHRYEFNNKLRKDLEAHGLVFSGEWPETRLMEIVEIRDHPFMLGSQFHPEFQSRPHRPHPLFTAFMNAVLKK
ncbi:CTP synthase, partial [Candidatus Peribacteria bacterium]|nr:CTP synthase [Candidatus Peribacteria bacterium]